jgi:hypothetical protein
MLKKYYSRAAAKDGEAKQDGGDGDTGGFPVVENVFLIFGGGGQPTHVQQPAQTRTARSHRCGEGSSLLPRLVRGRITFIHEDHPNHIPNPG